MRLADMAKVIRSKNAGPFELTLDVMFEDTATFERVLESKAISADSIAALYGMDKRDILGIVAFPPAHAIKITMVRPIPCGGVGDTDIYGAQQHAPLMELNIPS